MLIYDAISPPLARGNIQGIILYGIATYSFKQCIYLVCLVSWDLLCWSCWNTLIDWIHQWSELHCISGLWDWLSYEKSIQKKRNRTHKNWALCLEGNIFHSDVFHSSQCTLLFLHLLSESSSELQLQSSYRYQCDRLSSKTLHFHWVRCYWNDTL